MINLGYVERMTKKDVQLENGTPAPVDRGNGRN